MRDDLLMQLAMLTRLQTLSVCTTGAISLSATATSFVRTTGSFKTDGFWDGMELLAAAMSAAGNNARRVVSEVNDLTMEMTSALTVEAVGAGKTLSVGLPNALALENRDFTPTAGVPWVQEEYLPGPLTTESSGPLGILRAEPQYVIKVNVPSDTGIGALAAYVKAITTLFAPSTNIAIGNGDVLQVRRDVGPFGGQRLPHPKHAGFSVAPITIPFRCFTPNSI